MSNDGERVDGREAGATDEPIVGKGAGREEMARKVRDEEAEKTPSKRQQARAWTEKLLTRVTTGIVYLVVFISCLFWGTIPTAVIVAAMAWLCCSEFYRMLRRGGRNPNEIIGLAAALCYPASVLVLGYQGLPLVTMLLLIAIAGWYVYTPRASISDVAATAFGPIYTSLAFSSLVIIRCADPGMEGAYLSLGVLCSIWLNDTCAFLVGSRIGKHKLAPKISPNKSYEGFFGGLVGCMATWVAISVLGIRSISLPLAIVCGVAVGLVSVLGDLFESRIKRGVAVKDSGDVLPGHGGLLDRSDSILFGAMTACLILGLGGCL